jgi:suppressor of G2 allele of SKP1
MLNDENEEIIGTTEALTAHASLSLADSFFVDEDYNLAVDGYAAALAVASDNDVVSRMRALSHRSAAFYQLQRYAEASDDAHAALACPPTEGLRPGEAELCHKRLGLACVQLKQYAEAKRSMEQAMQIATLNGRDASQYKDWIRQCDEQLNPKGTGQKPIAKKPPAEQPAPAFNRRPTMPKYQYYQSDTIMTIAILEPNVQQDDMQVTFAPKHLTVKLRKGGVDFTILNGTLFDRVDVERCKTRILDEKILIKLRKTTPHEWHELMGKHDEQDEATIVSTEDVPLMDADKPRAYASHRDWDAIERNLKLQESQEKPEGEEAMNRLFQDIYGKADENTRRAMVKSYQTSGGTVLSTNWDEVAKKDYEKERTAPEGMEWKTWGGDKLGQKDK